MRINHKQLKNIVKSIIEERSLIESGIKTPKVSDDQFDIHGDDRLGDAIKQNKGPELSDTWYETLAYKFIQDYGTNIEGNWEEVLVNRYCSSVKATSGVDVDCEKLYKSVNDLIKNREDNAIKGTSLKEIANRLRKLSENEEFDNAIEEQVDVVEELIHSNLTPIEYVAEAKKLFCVKEASIPAGIRKYRLGESSATSQTFPVLAKLPHKSEIRQIDEQALDLFVKNWTSCQALKGEPLVLSWSPSPTSIGAIGFNIILR